VPVRLWIRAHAGHDTTGVIAQLDKGAQYLAVRYTERLADASAVASVGSTGDSYDNTWPRRSTRCFKTELVRNKGPWKRIDDLEIAAAEYFDWSTTDAYGEIGLVPPVEFEDNHYRHHSAPTTVGAPAQSLR
jgi:putative transposase